jgi:hypothetical protein
MFQQKIFIFFLLSLSSFQGAIDGLVGGAKRDRTADLLLARQALSQLSYGPLQIPSKLNKWGSRLVLSHDYPHSLEAMLPIQSSS